MALIKLTGGLLKISGKLGGSIFGTSSNGSYVKQNSFSQQPNTPKQSIQRNRIIQASQSWRLTSPAQKQLWSDEVVNYPYENAVGDIVFYNGFQLFQFLNQNNFINGFPVLLSPPVFVPVVNADWFVTTNPSSQLIVGTTNGVSGTKAIVFCARAFSGGVSPSASTYRKTLEVTMSGGSQSAGLEAAFVNVFGPQAGNVYVWVKIKTVVSNNGNITDFTTPDFELFNF